MGGGVSSHGRRSIVSWEEEYRLMGGGVSSHGRRSIVSWEEEYRLMGGGVSYHGRSGASKEKCQRSLGEEDYRGVLERRSLRGRLSVV
eukprot:gene12242-2877_t